jgi:hypothetical protein
LGGYTAIGVRLMRQSYDYLMALRDSQRHHASRKTFSGKLFRPHAQFVKTIIDEIGCKSILDYGAGKGIQYEWVMPKHGTTIEQYWGVEVTKYDPAWPPFAKEPEGKFDLVICTHTLGAIPAGSIPGVVERLHEFAAKAIYIAEKVGFPPKKKVFRDPLVMPVGWTSEKWLETVNFNGQAEVVFAIKELVGEAVYTTHWHSKAGGPWEKMIWPEGVRAMNHEWA